MGSWDFWRVVLIVTMGGACGGGVNLASIYISPADGESQTNGKSVWSGWFCFNNVVTGVGGAWAGLLAILWAKRFDVHGGVEELLKLLATSIIAGYAGNRLLPAIAERLTKELLQQATASATTSAASARSDAESAKADVERIKADVEAARRSALITQSVAYLEKDASRTTAKTNEFIGQLEEELSWNPRFRQAAILLGRMYAEAKNMPDDAIFVMNRFIEAKRNKDSKDDDDVADAFWNMANFYEQQYNTSDPKDAGLRRKAIQCLEESIKIRPSYLGRLQEDEDFDHLRKDHLGAKFRGPRD